MTRLFVLLFALSPLVARAEIGVFAGFEWRGMYIADHLAHGPGVQAGITLLNGHLKVGLMGFMRPGQINPATFEVTLPTEYKGQSTVRLRSDGAAIGLFVAPVFDVPGTPLSIELPVCVGQGAFGFYLTDDNRNTPDGRRVSKWENELLDGRDSSVGVSVEGGVRVALKLADAPWLRPYLGVSGSTVIGYNAFVKPHYAGIALVLGVQVGRFE